VVLFLRTKLEQPYTTPESNAMLTGLNHLTLSVRDLDRSVIFYRNTLGLRLHARWDRGAYLSAGDLWLCLSLDAAAATGAGGYTHYAFSISKQDFPAFATGLRMAGVAEWQQNRSAGDSLYFLDPEGHRLEAHAGSLAQRLAACRAAPYQGMTFDD
jgi:catechol 2,3-dioxygenase-like lactoylglutathione lyase family enzyme